SQPPPWVGAVLWASLHALPQGNADQYLALAALPSCLRGAPAATPLAGGVRGAAGGAGIGHLGALWGIPGVGGSANGDGGGDEEADIEEAKATVEMLVSRSLLHRRSPVVDGGGGVDGDTPVDVTASAAGTEALEPDRYAMHALQAAYVRSVARGRLDLMKTLDARRE
ncbi:unnamed protein product, partial [Ectocarpus fasciculatus]